MSNRIKSHHPSIYQGVYSQIGLDTARQHLKEARAHKPVDSFDERMRNEQIEMLQDVIRKREEGIAALKARESERKAEGEQQVADAAAKRKEDALAKLRPFFPGTDEEFQAQAESLYQEHLRQEMETNIARARARMPF